MKIVKVVCNLCEEKGNPDNPMGGFIIEADKTVKLVSVLMANFHLCESCIAQIGKADRSGRK